MNHRARLSRLFSQLLLGVAAVTFATSASAQVSVRVVDKEGQPVEGVYVLTSTSSEIPAEETYVMDQVDMAFSPAVLVVPVGAEVTFPNSDPVAHHVYSVSRPNNFVLPLYRGELPNPIRFEHEGVVVLGCNIHDHMVGHIVVSDRVVQGKTDATGSLIFELTGDPLDPGPSIQIWSPRLHGREITTQSLRVQGEHVFQLERRLRRPIHRIALKDY